MKNNSNFTDEEILALFQGLMAEHVDGVGAGTYDLDEVAFARALLARYAAPQASADARNAALEEAAKACEDVTKGFRIPVPIPATRQAWKAVELCASAVRALKSTPAPQPADDGQPHDFDTKALEVARSVTLYGSDQEQCHARARLQVAVRDAMLWAVLADRQQRAALASKENNDEQW